MKFCINKTSKILSRFSGLVLIPKFTRNTGRYLSHCHLFLIRKSVYLGSVSVCSSASKHDCKPFSAAEVSPDAKDTSINQISIAPISPTKLGSVARHIHLAIISVDMVRDSVPRDHATEWSGIEGKTQRT